MESTISIQMLDSNSLEKQHTISFFEELINAPIYFTTSCTTALELAAIAIGIKPGDEVIIPSYTFVGTANAFAKLGATIVFIDIEPKTMCLDINLLAQSITPKTKAIVPVHYAGNCYNIESILALAKSNNIFVIEDAAQCIFSYHHQKHVGTYGDIGCISFDYAKNIQCQQGGMVIVNNKNLIEKIDKAYHNGTNKSDFIKGKSQNFEWQSLGSNFVLADIHFSILYQQIIDVENIQKNRVAQWYYYFEQFSLLEKNKFIELPPPLDEGNAHIFFIKTNERDALLNHLHKNNIDASFHFIPLHSSSKGKEYKYISQDDNTTKESNRIIRLPLGININTSIQDKIIQLIYSFYSI